MVEGTGCALAGLLGLPGFEVELVEREADGSSTVHVAVAAGTVARCPDCATASGRVKEVVGHTVRHLVVVPVRVTWRKRRMTCENTGCPRGGFVEDTPLAVPGGRVSVAALETMGHLVGDWMVPVSRVAGVLGASWHTAHGGFVRVADQAGIVVADPAEVVEVAAAPQAGPLAEAGTEPAGGEPAGETVAAGPKPRRSVSGGVARGVGAGARRPPAGLAALAPGPETPVAVSATPTAGRAC